MALKVSATASDDDRHFKDITTLLFYRGKLYSGAEDGKVKIWNPDLTLSGEFQAHYNTVYHLAADGETLYTCSNDGTLRSWLINTGIAKGILLNYEDEIWRLFVSGGKLYAGDVKGIVAVFENEKLKRAYNLVEEVWDLIVEDNLLYTVRDNDVVVTEMVEGKTGRFTTKATIMGRGPMCKVDGKLCFLTRCGMNILVHEGIEKKFKELGELQSHTLIVNALCGASNKLYSGGWDNTVKQWNLDTMTCTDSLELCGYINTMCMGLNGEVYVGGRGGFLQKIEVT